MHALRRHTDAESSTAALRDGLMAAYRDVRGHSLHLASPLGPEDQCVQSMPDASPTKWHLAHTTWFFETLVLEKLAQPYRAFDARFTHLFNSYYEAIGPRHPRPQRGLLTRPTHGEVRAYRAHVDAAVLALVATADSTTLAALEPILSLGLHHEQQHQELLVTDILHAFSCNPVLPALLPLGPVASATTAGDGRSAVDGGHGWLDLAGGIVAIGHDRQAAPGDFHFDNETPRHPVLLQPYRLARHLVRCGDFAEFIADGGYRTPALWLSDGWARVQAEGWTCPAYWYAPGDLPARWSGSDAAWNVFGQHGLQPMDPQAPVSQLSFYEAAAYAEWAGARLPTEFEWEAAWGTPGLHDMVGKVWQWTRSSYDPYPGFRPLPGLAAEYNGKFMVGQVVLRGGSAATPPGHTRPTYRNFFPPAARWQFSGLRLAKDQ